MNHQPNPPMPVAGTINEQAKTAVQMHRIKLRLLTTAGFVCGFVAIVASTCIVWFYMIMYLPRQRQLMEDLEQTLRGANLITNSAAESMRQITQALGVEATLTHLASMEITMVALSVGVLGLGMLVLLTVVVLNRRAALDQINASLAQISNQLRQLKSSGDVEPPR